MSERKKSVRDLTPAQRTVLEERLTKKRSSGAGHPLVEPRTEGSELPLSFAQQRLWLLEELEPGSAAYNTPGAYRLEGEPHLPALRAALSEIARRHESLRSRFRAEDGSPHLVIDGPRPVPLPLLDLSGLAEADRNAEARALTLEEARRSFDLARGPLFRAALLRFWASDHVLLVTMHHIVSDGWSLGIFLRELRALYRSFAFGVPSPLREPSLQYADFARWQRRHLAGEVLEKQLSYWRKQLSSLPALSLPTDFPGPRTSLGRGGRMGFRIDAGLTGDLNRLAQAEGATLFMVLLAAFQILMQRYSGQDDVVVGSAIANRHRSELEGTIGFFANTLPMRTDLSGDPELPDLLERVRRAALEAHEHQDVPFEKLVSELAPERDLGSNPLFQVVFAFQNLPREAGDGTGSLRIRPLESEGSAPRFDLTFELGEGREGIVGAISYRRDRFREERIAAMASHYKRLLASIARSPGSRLSELEIFEERERAALLAVGNDTRRPYPESTVHAAFESEAAKRPDAIALTFGAERFSYRDLDSRANRLAHHLKKLGVSRGSRVGIALDRSPRLIEALLAVLKAGGAYVALDPTYPRERLLFLCEDSGLAALVTESIHAGSFSGSSVPRVLLDDDEAAIAETSEAPLETSVGPNDLAYVTYTSGSTGIPKGVAVPHRGVLRLVTDATYVRLGPEATILQLAPISFDASTFEIWGALLNGGRLALYPERVPTAEELGRALRESDVTTLWLTASLFNAVVDDSVLALRPVKELLVGGEALSVAHVSRALESLPETTLVNGYGPTEGTTFTCCYRIPREGVGELRSIPIGTPIGNTTVYLLDSWMNPVPAGVAGELYIGGDGLARGYQSRPDLTAEKFAPDPFSERSGARLYRTGDVVRRLSDGSIEYLGRCDQQVKVRGFRIELEEVGSALRAHPEVSTAAVLALDDGAGQKRLSAFVVWRESPRPFAEIRSFLARTLPEPMLPSELVTVDALPLTENGKLDREKLLALRPDAPALEAYVPPRGPIEEALADIWKEVLGTPSIGARDRFFEVGGQSLAAARVVSRIRKVFGVELPLRAIFETERLADLAERIGAARKRRGKEENAPLPPVEPRRPGGATPLSLPQQRLWLLDRLGLGGASYNVSGALRLEGELDRKALGRSLTEIVRRHESLRTTIDASGTEQHVEAPPESFPLPVIDLSPVDPEKRKSVLDRLLAEEAGRPCRLETGPLFRSRLFALSGREHVFSFTMHHIIADGWSIGIFLRELAHFYRAHVRGRAGSLPPPRVQYGDYAVWQKETFAGEVLSRQLDFWRDRLGDAPPPSKLPFERMPSAPSGRRFARPLREDLSRSLAELARRHDTTLFTVLVAGFQALLHRYSGDTDILLGTPVANRQQTELEDVIGFFVNTVVVRSDLSGRPSFGELVRRLREDLLAAYDHAEVPFEKIVAELRPRRNEGENPFFQAVVAFQSGDASGVSIAGLEAAPYPIELRSLRFDFELHLWDQPSGLLAVVSYNAGRFERAAVSRIVDHFEALLTAAAVRPETPVAEISFLTSSEKEAMSRWNRTASEYPRESVLHRVFEEVAAERGHAVALRFEGESLTYRELDLRSNQLARALRKRGVGPETRVGVALPRSLELPVAILGILKAGGAYVPIDPEHPAERLRFLLEDSEVRLTLAHGDFPGTVLDPVRDRPSIEAESEEGLSGFASADALAYVMYTSGSTGKPKGVAVSHRAVLRLVLGTDYVSLGPGERILQLAPASFDASTFEIWGALLHGGRLVLHPGRVPSAEGLASFLREERISTLWLTASLFNTLVDEDPGLFAPVSQLLVGGEALSVPHVRKALARTKSTRLINGYGPTEGTTFSCCYAIPADLSADAASISIGSPIANTIARVLDENLEPVPPGVEGELFLGGDGIARGYLDRPALTAEKFVPDPLAGEPGRRLYRTGDRVRLMEEGRLEYLGRRDQQLKIRGFRVEPGEVEAALREHPAISEAAVVAGRDERGEKTLQAFVVGLESASERELRRYLESRLPQHMVPSSVVRLERLPLTPNGKLDREALPAPGPRGPVASVSRISRDVLEERIAACWRQVLNVERVGMEDNFFDVGGHSLLLVKLQGRLTEALGLASLSILDLFRHPTIRSLADFLRQSGPEGMAAGEAGSLSLEPIAVIGLAGRFPQSENVEVFWENLRAGRECITFFTDEELLSDGLDPIELRHPQYVKARGALQNAEFFDAAFFGYTPREAEILDPQQRLFLETAWEALERAGYGNERYRGVVSVFAGASSNLYQANLASNPEILRSVGRYQTFLSNDKDFLSTRVSYKLNLGGPSVTVQTACSTSLSAVHLACQSLREGDCELAVAGGVSIAVPRRQGYRFLEGGILSKDGHCRAFDSSASGTVRGEGVGAVVLKRLSRALASGDRVEAVILGSALNNDGSQKVGYTAPGIEGQAEVISRALSQAGVESASVSYVETHGTGTALGDPIEVAALKKVFGAGGEKTCALGSLKTNVGHLDAAAGVASLMKTVLALRNEAIPASLHYETPNPELRIEESPFYVSSRLSPWMRRSGSPRRAGVSSFGIGGTNVHVVLEEAPAPEISGPSRRFQPLTLSAKSETALGRMTEALASRLAGSPEDSLPDVAFTLAMGRSRFAHRRILVAEGSVLDASRKILSKTAVETRYDEETKRGVAFLYPGQGTQYVNMGRELFEEEEVFRDELERGFAILRDELALEPRDVLYPRAGEEPNAEALLRETRVLQPLLFLVEHALSSLWRSLGVEPSALLGHSIGEYVAASIASVFDFESGLRLAALRGRLMQEAPRGAMTSVPLSEEELQSRLGPGLSLAAVNGRSLTVVSGPTERVEELEGSLSREGVSFRRLATSHAFHSEQMEPILAKFSEAIRGVRFDPPRIPYVSNVTGTWIEESEATDPEYWVRHLREPVRFAEGAARLLENGSRAVIEVGGGRALPAELRGRAAVVVPTLGAAGSSESRGLVESVGRLWLAGVDIDWRAYYAREKRRRVLLPTYSFERRRYWIDAPAASTRPPSMKRRDVSEWLYAPVWRSSALDLSRRELPSPPSSWLFFADEAGLSDRIASRFGTAIRVRAGARFARLADGEFTLRPDASEDYEALFQTLDSSGVRPSRIAHGFGLDEPSRGSSPRERFEIEKKRGFESLALLARVLERRDLSPAPRVFVLTSNLHDVTGDEALAPEKAAVLGLLKVLPQENRALAFRGIDLALSGGPVEARLLDAVSRELLSDARDPLVALRGRKRFVPEYERISFRREAPSLLRPRGVYWLTGGLGRIGMTFAARLAKQEARLVLIGRTGAAPRDEARIRALEEIGAEVMVEAADVAVVSDMRRVLASTLDRFGALHGVFHAAGVTSGPSFRPVVRLSREQADEQFRAKVLGLLTLEEVLRDLPDLPEKSLDFVLLSSSISAVLGGIGYAAYAAANAVMDRYAVAWSRSSSTYWSSVAWDGWQFGPAAVSREVGTVADLAMTPDEGVRALEGVLRTRSPHVVVATADLAARIERWTGEGLDAREERTKSSPVERVRPRLATEFRAPRTGVERAVVELYERTLGMEGVGIDDDFFELGGHSLAALQLASQLSERFAVEMPMHRLFEGPTAAAVAEFIERGGLGGRESLEKLEGLLSSLETMVESERDD